MVSHMQGIAHKNAQDFSPNIEEIDPRRASEMLATMKYEYQRPIRQDHVKFLAAEMTAGRFVPGTTIRIAYVDGTPLLIDGQHRLSAVVASNTPQIFVVLEEAAPDRSYVAWAYGSLDIGKRRVASDLYKAMTLAERLGMSNTALDNLAPAVSFLVDGMKPGRSSGRRIDRAEHIRLIELYAPHMLRFLDLTGGAEKAMSRALQRSYVIAIALLTLRFAEPYAEHRAAPEVAEFWRGVAFDDKIAVDDPRKVANRHLLTTTMASPRNAVGARSVTNAPYGARYIASCFNAYMARKSREFSRVMDDTAPVRMYGVPRDMAQWID